MSKKLIYLVSFVLVCGVQTPGAAAPEDHLVLHLPFDEGSGAVTEDISKTGLQVTLGGSYEWTAGKFGQAVAFTGGQATVVDSDPLNVPLITVMAWVNPTAITANVAPNHYTDIDPIYEKRGSGDDSVVLGLTGGDRVHFYVDIGSDRNLSVPDAGVQTGQWQHVAGTFDGTMMRVFLNGEQIGEMAASGTIITNTNLATMAGRTFRGAIDEVKVYDQALTADEIKRIVKDAGGGFPLALRPDPEDGSMYENTWANITWRPGDFAVSHDVYFGDNFDDVNDGAEGTFVGNQAGIELIVGFPGYPYPEGLVPGMTYYWRIDEVNDTEPNSPWKGEIWSFSVPPRTAYKPNPADGVKFVAPDVELNWTSGFQAKLHYVHFGDNFDDVNNAVVGLPQAVTSYTPGTLEFDKVYYWRIDEFDGVATNKGDVWSFKTLPVIPITDPSLVGWWKLDEGMGTTAVDWSGHGNHGTLMGDPQWVPGFDGDALEFDGNGDYVDCGDSPALNITDEITVACWIKVVAFSKTWETIVAMGDDSYRMSRGPGTGDSIHFACDGTTGGNLNATTIVTDDTWHHVALVYDGSNKIIYIDGAEDARVASTGPIDVSIYSLSIGENLDATSRHLTGLVDNVRIYNRALAPDEISQAMRGDPLLAWGPKPGNGSTPYIRDATPLSWSPGDNASQHDVYFGTDRGAVADADASDTTGIYRGRQGGTVYTPAEGVEWGGGPYYWRVDEYNTDATMSKGNVWTFTVADSILIEDFEDYNDYPPDEIFSTWIDGYGTTTNGSTAGYPDPDFLAGEHYVETTIVHGGSQSMPVLYENNFKYSEVTMTLVSMRNWTEEGVGVLSLWFYGDASNAAERMYVALNGSATVYHDDPSAAQIATWTEWTIDLQEFAAQGVNLANVNTITIGFGDKNNLQAGGSGMVFFDDIRLYRPAPEPAP